LQPKDGQAGVRRENARDRTRAFRVIVRQQDFHLCVSLLRMPGRDARSMPHCSTAVLAGWAVEIVKNRLNRRQWMRGWMARWLCGLPRHQVGGSVRPN
jgi:hypothetical protein